MQVTERALKFLTVRFARVREKRLGEIDEIAVRKRFLEKMNGAQSGGLLSMGGEMRAGQDDGTSVWMTRAQVVEEFLPKIGHRLDVENEEVRLGIEHDPLRLMQSRGDVALSRRRSLLQGSPDFLSYF